MSTDTLNLYPSSTEIALRSEAKGHNIAINVSDGGHKHKNKAAKANKNEVLKKLFQVVVLAAIFMTIETIGGIIADSTAILSDAAHMLSDLLGFVISIVAVYISALPANDKNTFGYHRAGVVGALASVVLIWLLTGGLVYYAIMRIIYLDTIELDSKVMIFISCIGLVMNLVMVKVLHGGDHGHSHCSHSHSHAPVIKPSSDSPFSYSLFNDNHTDDSGEKGHKHDHHHEHGKECSHDHKHEVSDKSNSQANFAFSPVRTGKEEVPQRIARADSNEKLLPAKQNSEETKPISTKNSLDTGSVAESPLTANIFASRESSANPDSGRGEHDHGHNHQEKASHDHDHDNEHHHHDHGHNHSHAHTHDHGHDHKHSHGPNEKHVHSGSCSHGHSHGQKHSHDHSHEHKHSHDDHHDHKHSHDDHDHDHDHHGHSHSHGHHHGHAHDDLNIRAAMIHIIGDILQSVGVIIGSIIIHMNPEKLKIIDPLLTILFSIIVLFTTKRIVVDCMNVIMQSTPAYLDVKSLKQKLKKIPNVTEVHNLHVWSLTTDKYVLSAHLETDADANKVLAIATKVCRDFGIQHSTIQVEVNATHSLIDCEHDFF